MTEPVKYTMGEVLQAASRACWLLSQVYKLKAELEKVRSSQSEQARAEQVKKGGAE